MADYQLVTDATCDMNLDLLERYHIKVIPMEVTMDDGRSFLHYPDFRNFSAGEFYSELRAGNYSKSTQISPQQFIDFFSPDLAAGLDILYICFSSQLSGTYQSALLSKDELLARFPGRRIEIIDSLCACSGEGVFALQSGINKYERGMSLEENVSWLEENRLRVAHYFTVGDLSFLHKGGRVSATTAVVGTALNIKPMLIVDEEGKLAVVGRVRGRRAAMQRLLDMTMQTIEDAREQTLYVGHADCLDDAILLKQMVENAIACKEVVITGIGPVIGTHTGPSLLCLLSWGRGRRP